MSLPYRRLTLKRMISLPKEIEYRDTISLGQHITTPTVLPLTFIRFSVIISVGGIKINNIYKLLATTWRLYNLATSPHLAGYVGYFNSQHTLWKYRSSGNIGEIIMNWTDDNNIYFTFDAERTIII